MVNCILERVYLQGVLRPHNAPYIEDVPTNHFERGCVGYAPVVNGRRTWPFPRRSGDQLGEVVILGCDEHPGEIEDEKRTIRPPTRITITPRSSLDLPPNKDIWVKFHDNISYPVQQF